MGSLSAVDDSFFVCGRFLCKKMEEEFKMSVDGNEEWRNIHARGKKKILNMVQEGKLTAEEALFF